MAVVAVTLLCAVLLGEAQAGKIGRAIDHGRSNGSVDPVERAYDGDRISHRDDSGNSGNRDRLTTKVGTTIGGEKYPQRGAPSEMVDSYAFSTPEIYAAGMLSALSIVAVALGLVELFRLNAA